MRLIFKKRTRVLFFGGNVYCVYSSTEKDMRQDTRLIFWRECVLCVFLNVNRRASYIQKKDTRLIFCNSIFRPRVLFFN